MLTKEQAVEAMKAYIAANKISYAEYGRMIGYCRASVCQWIRGKTTPSYKAIKKIEEIQFLNDERIKNTP